MRGKLAHGPNAKLSPAIPFNEARALCAGNCAYDNATFYLQIAFNEARALCAGNSAETRCIACGTRYLQ